MPLYQCESCDCVENTALGSYWERKKKNCSGCSTGIWHGKFKKRSAEGMYYTQAGFLYNEPNNHHVKDYQTIGQIVKSKSGELVRTPF